MQRLLDSLGNFAVVLCGGACVCVVGLFIFGGMLIRFAGVSLVPLVGDLLVGRADRTPEKRTSPALTRPTSGAVLKSQAQSLDFDEALRRQGGASMQAQAAPQGFAPQGFAQQGYPTQPQQGFVQQGYPTQPQQGYANTGYGAQSAPYTPSLQSLPPATAPQVPTASGIQPLYDNRVLPQQPMQAPVQPSLTPAQQYPTATPYGPPPSGVVPTMPSITGQPTPYQPLSGGYQSQAAPSTDPNAFFPPPNTSLPRRASLSAPREVSPNTMPQQDFNTENYPGLRRSSGRRSSTADARDTKDEADRSGIGGIINDLGNMIGM